MMRFEQLFSSPQSQSRSLDSSIGKDSSQNGKEKHCDESKAPNLPTAQEIEATSMMLSKYGLSRYFDLFIDNGYTLNKLLTLAKRDLINVGNKMIPQKCIIKHRNYQKLIDYLTDDFAIFGKEYCNVLNCDKWKCFICGENDNSIIFDQCCKNKKCKLSINPYYYFIQNKRNANKYAKLYPILTKTFGIVDGRVTREQLNESLLVNNDLLLFNKFVLHFDDSLCVTFICENTRKDDLQIIMFELSMHFKYGKKSNSYEIDSDVLREISMKNGQIMHSYSKSIIYEYDMNADCTIPFIFGNSSNSNINIVSIDGSDKPSISIAINVSEDGSLYSYKNSDFGDCGDCADSIGDAPSINSSFVNFEDRVLVMAV